MTINQACMYIVAANAPPTSINTECIVAANALTRKAAADMGAVAAADLQPQAKLQGSLIDSSEFQFLYMSVRRCMFVGTHGTCNHASNTGRTMTEKSPAQHKKQ